MKTRITAYVALGSNLGDPAEQIRSALRSLAALPGTRLAGVSSLYRNPPEDGTGQPEYVNAVARVETQLEARELLEHMFEVERAHGRVRSTPNAPRTLDLDLVLYGNEVVREPD